MINDYKINKKLVGESKPQSYSILREVEGTWSDKAAMEERKRKLEQLEFS